jgi:formate/nitrite transporter FocA (FNT family)
MDEHDTRSPRASGDDAKRPTRRSEEREREEEHFVPVILKRTDQARRHPDDVLQTAIAEGAEQLGRGGVSLWLSAVSAGLMLGFSAMAVAVVTVVLEPLDIAALERFAVALVYPLGFVVCLMSGVELFTEHTATAVYPVLDRRARVSRLVRLWAIVIAGNLLGALASALLLGAADAVVGAAEGYTAVAVHVVAPGALPLLVSAVLAGWLMALGAWLILATPPTASQLYAIYIVTFLIGLGGLHHSIAGAVEVFTALVIGDGVSVLDAARFLALALTGNLIGGSLFVAALNYGHIRESQSGR